MCVFASTVRRWKWKTCPRSRRPRNTTSTWWWTASKSGRKRMRRPETPCASDWPKALKPRCTWPNTALLPWRWTPVKNTCSTPSFHARCAPIPSASWSRGCSRSTRPWARARLATALAAWRFLTRIGWWPSLRSAWPVVPSRAGTGATGFTSACSKAWPSITSSTSKHRSRNSRPFISRCCCTAQDWRKSSSATPWSPEPRRAKRSARSTRLRGSSPT